MKKLIVSFLLLSVLLSFASCEHVSDNTNEKGSRNNPYATNEVISFKALYENEKIDVSINVSDKILDKNEISEIYKKNYISSNWIETAMITFTVSCDGNYDSEIYLENLVEPIFVTSDMKEDATRGTIKDNSFKSLLNIYTGADYTVYEGTHDYTPDECKYLRLAYTDINGNDTDIWVEFTK